MKTKKVEKVITTLKNQIGHPLKRHLTEIPTWVNHLKDATIPNESVILINMNDLYVENGRSM